jgi:hypothetical protein
MQMEGCKVLRNNSLSPPPLSGSMNQAAEINSAFPPRKHYDLSDDAYPSPSPLLLRKRGFYEINILCL